MPLNQQPKLQWSVPFPNGPVTISVMTKTTTLSVDLMEVIVVITPARVGITIAASVSALKCQKPLKHPLKLLKNPGIPLKIQWRPLKSPWVNVLPHNGLETITVMMRTTPPSVDLMEEIVVITKWRATPTTAVLASAWNTQKPLNHPLKNPGIPLKTQWRPLKSPWGTVLPHNGLETIIVMMRTTPPSVDLMEEIVVITKWRATPTTAMLANAWNTQSQLKNLEQTVLPPTGLEMPFVMTKTTPKSVDLMVEIVVTMKDKDGTTIVLIVNVLHNFYVKNIFMHI